MYDLGPDLDLEREADEVFRIDAIRLGYMRDDPHEPGNGRGMRSYYRDMGLHPSTWKPTEPLVLADEVACE